MTAKEFLQSRHPYMRKHWNENEVINDEWIVQEMEQYAKEQNRSIAFKAWFSGMQQGVIFDHNDRKELWEKETKRMTFDEWYDQFKQQ